MREPASDAKPMPGPAQAEDLQRRAIETLRFLSADAVQAAGSGHPGLPMGAAAMAYTLWTRHLIHDPADPAWPGRDRFVLSGGHGSALLYSLLHLTGYDLPLEELRRFRQWQSRTPGHPEHGRTPGVAVTTGPLGQGFANAVGMALAEAHLAACFNRPGFPIVDHHTYVIATDGDLMEGVASEAASLAGHWRLGRLICLYDDNRISIDGPTDLAFTEDRLARFAAYGWHVRQVADGDDVDAIDRALVEARDDPRPSLIACRTRIGRGAPTREGTAAAHGEPLGEAELAAAKRQAGWPADASFLVPQDVAEFYRRAVAHGERLRAAWHARFDAYRKDWSEAAEELLRRLDGRLPDDWDAGLPEFAADPKGLATRAASGKVLDVLAARLPELVGGAADLAESTKARPRDAIDFQHDSPHGRYLRFGVREHAMGAILNGMALHGGIRPYGATFLVFSDYMRPALRLAAMMRLPVVWLFSHDSIGLGEDGPTHQPVEQLAALRAIPDLVVIRPADANETVAAWQAALHHHGGPIALVLTRQTVPTLTSPEAACQLARGAYVFMDFGPTPDLLLMASGSELGLVLEAARQLATPDLGVRVVSFPSWELFELQDQAYRDAVLPPAIRRRLAVEAGVGQGWERYVGDGGAIVSLEHFGASAPGPELFRQFGFSVEAIVERAQALLAR